MGCLPCFGSSGEGAAKKGGARKDGSSDRRVTRVGSDKSKPQGGSDSKKDAVILRDGNNQHIAAHTFTFRELAAATKNFRQDCLLGEGGFGRVYKGRLENGQVVAVKQLDRNGLQGNREFLVEVLMLSLLHHDNLVNLIGYCADGDQRLLVYEFMPLGSLEDHLHDIPPDKEPLDWNTRMKIAAGAAKGLEYLHDKASPPVIYRDFKSSNILLGEGFHPKLSDFGLAKLGPVGDKTHVSTRVMGTYGYCAPVFTPPCPPRATSWPRAAAAPPLPLAEHRCCCCSADVAPQRREGFATAGRGRDSVWAYSSGMDGNKSSPLSATDSQIPICNHNPRYPLASLLPMESSAPNLAESSSSVTTVHGDSSPDAADVTRLYLAAAAAAATNAIDLDDLRVALASVRDDILSNEDYDLDAPLHREDVPRFLEKVGSVKCMNKALLLSVVLDILPRSRRTTDVCVLAESSRDFRHVGDLTWHTYYQMSELAETSLPPMRYTCCQDFKAKRCFHRPCPMLQIFGIKLKSYLADSTSPLKVYGFIAVRDAEDYRRNYLFNRSWDYPLTVNLASDFLRLMSPKRGMSMQFDCLIEVDIRAMSVTNDSEDKTLVDGCKELIEGRISMDKLFNRTMSREHGSATFDLIVFQNSVEATIQLIFSEVPLNGMDVQMCGYTAVGKNFYSFIGEQCECDSFITSDGRLPQYFIAAVQMGDTLFVDFMEGKLSIPFEAAIHGSEEKLYHFQNGAGVSVKASWSTTYY